MAKKTESKTPQSPSLELGYIQANASTMLSFLNRAKSIVGRVEARRRQLSPDKVRTTAKSSTFTVSDAANDEERAAITLVNAFARLETILTKEASVSLGNLIKEVAALGES